MLESFYREVLPGAGHYALFLGQHKQHVWFDSLEALSRGTRDRSEQQGVYFATASFYEPINRTIDNALLRRAFCFDIDAGPAKVAKHGLDAVYASQVDALRALFNWSKSSRIVPTYVVSSGAGLHVYFTVNEDVPISMWQPVATALKAMAAAQGLKIDAGCTGDPVRVLRPPGTLHSSGDPVKVLDRTGHVFSLLELSQLVAEFTPRADPPRHSRLNEEVLMAPAGPPRSIKKIGERCAIVGHALSARGDVPEPYWRAMLGLVKHTVEGEAGAHALSEGHPEYDYDETQRKYERWSVGPPTCATFQPENPAACASCAYRDKVRSPIMLGELTPPEVAQLAENRAAASPSQVEPVDAASEEQTEQEIGGGLDGLVFGEAAPPESSQVDPWTAYLPDKYAVRSNGREHVMVKRGRIETENDAGDKVEVEVDLPFASVPFWFESWAPGTNDADQAITVYGVFDVARQTVHRYTMPTKAAAQRNDFMGALASQNVQAFPSTKTAKDLMEDYVKASLERIRVAGQRQKITERFGTAFSPTGDTLVAQGQYIIRGDGTIVEGVVQEKLRQRGTAYRVPVPPGTSGRWGPEVWDGYIMPRALRHVAYLREVYSDENFAPYQLAIMLAWASPMLAFMQGTFQPGTPLPGAGLTVSLYSPRSGIGKTAAMHAAALAFGSPSGICLQLDRNNSTDNARQGLLLQSGTMPSFMDEMEDVEAADMAALISAVGNGASKLRMTKETALTGGVTTALINVMSTNKSHRELVAAARADSPAVQMRMLEIECSGVQEVSRERGMQETQARAALHDCAGALGAVLHRQMCVLGAEQLNRLGVECAGVAQRMLSGRQDGRFLWRALGAMLAVRRILKASSADLHVFDGARLVQEFQTWHDASYEFSTERLLPNDGLDQLSLFLSDIAGNTLVTRSEGDRRASGGLQMVLNDRMPDNVAARSVLDAGCVYIKVDALRTWCLRRKISQQMLLKECRDQGVFERRDGRWTHFIDLYRGTKLAQSVPVGTFKVLLHTLRSSPDFEQLAGENVVALPLRNQEGEKKADRQVGFVRPVS